MDPKIAKELATISQKLQIGVEHLWALSVKQAYISAISDIISCILLIITTYVFITVLKKTNFKEEKPYDFPIKSFVAFSVGCLLVIYWLYTLDTFDETVTKLFNPEYAAFQNIMKLVHSGSN